MVSKQSTNLYKNPPGMSGSLCTAGAMCIELEAVWYTAADDQEELPRPRS